jgi:GNAT superfamily N-acetyltransferase
MAGKRGAGVRKSGSGDLDGIVFHPATPSRWKDIERLFGERGACGGCWCMAWRLPRKEWEAGKGAGNRKRLRTLIRMNGRPGVIAYHGREPVGWCAVAPRRDYPALARSRVLKPVDDSPVWSVSCLFVLRPWRRQGLSAALLSAAAAHAASRGARIVEGYPVIPYSKEAPGAFLWTGTPGAFERAGFREVHRWSKARPIVRLEVRRPTPSSHRS